MKIVELKLTEDIINSGIAMGAISIVEAPAVETLFMKFSKDEKKKYSFSIPIVGDKQIVYSAALIPNKLILRQYEDTGEYYQVYFSEDTVAKCSEVYLRNNFNSFTIGHENSISDIYITESWIIDSEKDKAYSLGFEGLPKGTWMVAAKIDNKIIWEKVKNGELNGWSIESFFSESFSKISSKKEFSKEDYIKNQLEIIYSTSKTDEEAKIKLEKLYNN
jgi:hypothetical protein